MCEVLRSNFETLFPDIEQSIQDADFIAIDAEFSGLRQPSSKDERPSLFDTGEERYKKLRRCVSQFTLMQIGLSAFVKDVKDNRYIAHTYNIHLFPSSFGPNDDTFMCQASSLEFLAKFNFDFNKWVYEGVPYLNNEQERKLKTHLANENVETDGLRSNEHELQEMCSKVAHWLATAKESDTCTVPLSEDLCSTDINTELRHRFSNIWTREEGCHVVVEKIPTARHRELMRQSTQKEQETLLDHLLGFTKIFRALVKSKKPIIGHNNLTDLMLMYDKFYNPLPVSFRRFKEDLCRLFPSIYDTKHISACLRKPLGSSGLFETTGLATLYAALDSRKGRFYCLLSPHMILTDQSSSYAKTHKPHEAGYDAYMCGYVFVRLAHIWTCRDVKSVDSRLMFFHEYLMALRQFRNCVNVIRASVDHVKMDGADPETMRPQWLFVQSRKGKQNLASLQLSGLFSSYGSVDIRMQNGQCQAVVAVSNHRW
ncbi:hypothetical protein NP493_1085g00046 [Ridgeia piscesae]|uniref:Uncharacterized protein n=1 Tax=Ridgeia piscesae TaxID=27915 RepID=A0AAD9KHJ3_RIDPI|nr:hypothetical protein NP493_1085g00046 [Ridgeia piscesae]